MSSKARSVGLLRGPQQRELLGVLRPPLPLDLLAHPRERDPVQRVLPALELRDRDGVLLEPQPVTPRRSTCSWIGPSRDSVDATRSEVGHLVPRLLSVATVGEEHGARRTEQQARGRPREPGEVPHVGEPGDQQRVDLQLLAALEQRVPPAQVIHGIASRAR